jgi:putative N-acetyltransferase (TIGR04045 family)
MSPVSSPTATSARAGVACRIARSPWDLDGHFAVRAAVFVGEQRVFAVTDQDALDDDPRTLHAVAVCDDVVCGAVRLHPAGDGGRWRGDRLATVPSHRRRGAVGARLVRFAVATAAARGGDRMDAHVQLPNVRFFTALGWVPDGPVTGHHGLPHQPMSISLAPARDR